MFYVHKLNPYTDLWEARVTVIHDSHKKTEAQRVSNMPQVERGRTKIYTQEAWPQSPCSEPLHTRPSNAHHTGPTQPLVSSRNQAWCWAQSRILNTLTSERNCQKKKKNVLQSKDGKVKTETLGQEKY